MNNNSNGKLNFFWISLCNETFNRTYNRPQVLKEEGTWNLVFLFGSQEKPPNLVRLIRSVFKIILLI